MGQIAKELAKRFVSRADNQRMTGKTRERAAMEYVAGALSYALITKGEESEEAKDLSLLAVLVASRGYAEIKRLVGQDGYDEEARK